MKDTIKAGRAGIYMFTYTYTYILYIHIYREEKSKIHIQTDGESIYRRDRETQARQGKPGSGIGGRWGSRMDGSMERDAIVDKPDEPDDVNR